MTSTETQTEKAVTSRIPHFATIEEEAEFWDTHDTTEFEDEFEEVTDHVFIGLLHDGRLILWLDPEQAAALTRQATEQGAYPARLALTWVLERLGYPAGPQEDSP